MGIINYISTIAVPLTIVAIIVYGVIDKKNTYDIFLSGARDGVNTVVKIFPTLIGIFLAVGCLRSSGLLDIISTSLYSVTKIIGLPSEVIPLALLRPISGSASLGVATDIMKTYGVDSKIGLIAATIIGSSETTFYTISLYTSSVGIKKTRYVLVAALIADSVVIIMSALIWNFM